MENPSLIKALLFEEKGKLKKCLKHVRVFEKNWKERKIKPSAKDLINYYFIKVNLVNLEEKSSSRENKLISEIEYHAKGFIIASAEYDNGDPFAGDEALWFVFHRDSLLKDLKKVYLKIQ